jgi:site-specific DNA-methyltransferase (adenine-specific)
MHERVFIGDCELYHGDCRETLPNIHRMEKAHEFQGWRMSQDFIWGKQNGTNAFNDRFRCMHEQIGHFYSARLSWSEVFKKPLFSHDAVARLYDGDRDPANWD